MLGPSLESLRPSMTCAICCELMTDPVIVCENGHCYDRPCISSWNRPCPECRQPLLSSWIPNRIIKENAARLQQPPAESLAPRVQLSPDDLLINAFKTNDLEAARQATDQDASFWSADAINHVSTQEMFSLLVNTFSKARMNLLREAVKQNKLDSLVMLWSLKPFVYPPNTPTVLHVACQQKNSVALHFLLSYEPPAGHHSPKDYTNALDDKHRTPLVIACQACILYNNPPEAVACTRLLLDHGADRNISTQVGNTPLDFAKSHQNDVLIRLLTESPAPDTSSNCAIQ